MYAPLPTTSRTVVRCEKGIEGSATASKTAAFGLRHNTTLETTPRKCCSPSRCIHFWFHAEIMGFLSALLGGGIGVGAQMYANSIQKIPLSRSKSREHPSSFVCVKRICNRVLTYFLRTLDASSNAYCRLLRGEQVSQSREGPGRTNQQRQSRERPLSTCGNFCLDSLPTSGRS